MIDKCFRQVLGELPKNAIIKEFDVLFHPEHKKKRLDVEDAKIAFPKSKGYSVRNLKYMAKFAATYPEREFVQRVVASSLLCGHRIENGGI